MDSLDERGQVVPLVAVLLAAAALAMVAVARLGDRATDLARAEAAAEAAALAAVLDDAAAAQRVAGANGAVLVSLDEGPPVVVTVRVDGVEATAAAAPLDGTGAG